VANDDRLHAIDCLHTNDFGVGHHHQLSVSCIRRSSNVPAKPLCRPCVGGEHDEYALSAPNSIDSRIKDGFRISGHDNIDGPAHSA
jgi:hypothetical protein